MKTLRYPTALASLLLVFTGACTSVSKDHSAAPDGGAIFAPAPDAGAPGPDSAPPPEPEAAVYAHSPSVLYKLDPTTLAVTEVGAFSGCSSDVVDIAVDKDGNIFAVSWSGVYSVDPDTAACTEIALGSYPNSLSFVPAGVLDDDAEVLVAYSGSSYNRIDIDTGEMTNIGTLTDYYSSGDVVSVEGGGTYLTAKGPSCADCLLQIDPTTGEMIKNWGNLGYSAVYGLAYWGGTAYGFDDSGAAFSITFGTDTVTTSPITIPDAPANLQFWGAGSTTIAPIVVE